jgi:hypothetical protein
MRIMWGISDYFMEHNIDLSHKWNIYACDGIKINLKREKLNKNNFFMKIHKKN